MAKESSARSCYLYRYQSVIQARLTQLSAAERAVAAHLAEHAAQLPFETAASIARRLGVSAMTVGRTLQALGYRGLSGLRSEMRSEVTTVAAGQGPRRAALVAAPASKDLNRVLAMRAELEAIEAVHALAETAAWHRAVDLIAAADRVCVMGFQSVRGLAIAFADQLACARRHVRYLSGELRSLNGMRYEAGANSCLVMIDCRRSSRGFRLLGQKVSGLGIPVIVATDAYCRWAADITQCALRARTDSGRFRDNSAPLSSLLNLLIEDVIERLGVAV